MEKSYKIKHIESNLLKLFALLYFNQNIAKYVYYHVDDPLSMPEVPIDLKENGNFLLTFFDGKTSTEEKIRIFFNVLNGQLDKQPLSDIIYLIEIVIPDRLWILNGIGQLRGFRILDEFVQMIDQQKVAGITEVEVLGFRARKVANSDYSVLSADIKVNSSTMKGLR